PVSSGHIHIAEKAVSLFDMLYIAVGENTHKNCMFELSKRVHWLEKATQHLENVQVVSFAGLTIDFCKRMNAKYIVRGVRNASDLEYERAIADTNMKLDPEIQTVFLLSDPSQTSVRSTILRELIRNNSDVSMFLPSGVNVYE
ncbi:MAG: pantetheine-phosphate adenylyltransferase, partial [Flavobacteriales bacterium]